MNLIRLQKVIADAGVLSRRKAEEAISAGRVSVNGVVVTELGTKIDPSQAEVCVDGIQLQRRSEHRTVLLYKPCRAVTTKLDPEGRRTVMEFFPPELQTLKPVGRLDYHTEGLLVLTEDGELANRMAHPRYGVTKVYVARVAGVPGDSVLSRLCQSVLLEDGPGRFESARRLSVESDESFVEVVVTEGRNRFVRRMLDAVGHPVRALKRIRVGALELGDLRPGEFRLLTADELASFRGSSEE